MDLLPMPRRVVSVAVTVVHRAVTGGLGVLAGGLGLLAGRAARRTGAPAVDRTPAARTRTRTRTGTGTGTEDTVSAIGANPSRRYRSAGSRALAKRG
jgi:hypothetical protein